jgi:hypothetical protein
MRKPNYRFERAERDRIKRAKKEEKAVRRQQERELAEKPAEADHADASAVSTNGERLEHRTPDRA